MEPMLTTPQVLKTVPLARYNQIRKTQKFLRLCSYEFNPNNRRITLGYLRALPGLRQWVGNRKHFKLGDDAQSVTATGYEETVDVHRKDVKENNLVEVRQLLAAMGQDAARLPVDLMFTLLRNGKTVLCYDGQYFFDGDHPDGIGGVNSNIVVLTGSTLTYLAADWNSAVSAMQGFKFGLTSKDDTRTLDKSPNAVVCHTRLARLFKILFGSKQYIQGGVMVDNPYYGEVPLENIFASSQVTDGATNTTWYAAYLEDSGTKDENEAPNSIIGPMLFFENEKFDTSVEDDSYQKFESDSFAIGGQTYLAVAPYAWFHIIRVDNT